MEDHGSNKQIKKNSDESSSNFMVKSLEDDLTKLTKEIETFQIIYSEFPEEDKTSKINKANQLLNECKEIFKDIEKGKNNILNKFQNKFNKNLNSVDEIIKRLKNYDKIKGREDLNVISKNILILIKKDIYYHDIKCLLYFIKLFEAEETEISQYLKEKKSEFENKEHFNFNKLVNINNYLENKKIYINNGKNDSSLIQYVRFMYDKEKEINFLKTKDFESTLELLNNNINESTDIIKQSDILEYLSCIDFIKDMKEKITDNNLLIKLAKKFDKNDINKVLSLFKSYFQNYGLFKLLDSKDLYGNIKYILNNSKLEISIFKKEFKVYNDNNKEITDIIAKDLNGLIKLKLNIYLNLENLSDNIILGEKQKKELDDKKIKIKKFIEYVEQIENIFKYFSKLENKGCPFFMYIKITMSKDNIIFELVNDTLDYEDLIIKLKEYHETIKEY